MLIKNESLVNEESKFAEGCEHKFEVMNETSFKSKAYPIPRAYKEPFWK